MNDFSNTYFKKFLQDFLFNICQDYTYSLVKDDNLYISNNINTIRNNIKNRIDFYLSDCFTCLLSYLNSRLVDIAYKEYVPFVDSIVNMIISARNLNEKRYKPVVSNRNECQKVATFLDTRISASFIKTLKTTFGTIPSKSNQHTKYAGFMKRLCIQILKRNSGCDYHVPPIWIENARDVYEYYKVGIILKRILKIIEKPFRISDIAGLIDEYYLSFQRKTGININDYHFDCISNLSDKKTVIDNLHVLIKVVDDYKGLNRQSQMLRIIARRVEDKKSDIIELHEKELLEPSFVSCVSSTNETNQIVGDINVKSFMNLQYQKLQKTCVNTVCQEIAILTMNCDDVQVLHSSTNNESVFALEFFFAGAPYKLHYTRKNCWFPCVTHATKARALDKDQLKDYKGPTNRTSIKRFNKEVDALAVSSATTETIYEEGWDDCDCTGIELKNVPDNFALSRVQKQLSPSNWQGRSIIDLILRDILFLGDRGIPILKNNTLHVIRPAILGFRFDNPAGDTVTNSSGKQGSNSPCRHCKIMKQTWVNWSNCIAYANEYDVLSNKRSRSIFMSALSSLERDDLLRIISLVSLFQIGDEKNLAQIIDPIPSECRDIYLVQDISNLLLSCSIEHTVYWSAPVTSYYPPCVPKNGNIGTNPQYSVGTIDFKNVISGNHVANYLDGMHVSENCGEDFHGMMYEKQDQQSSISESLCQELIKDFIIPEGTFLTSSEFSRHSILYAKYIFECNKKYLPVKIQLIIDTYLPSARNTYSSRSLTSNEKLHFILIYSQFLFPSSVVDHFCASYIRLFAVLGRIYTCRGSMETFYSLHSRLICLLNMIENEKLLDSSTINDHLLVHTDLSYLHMGPLKAVDCYEAEWTFKDFKNPIISPDPFVTLFKTQMDNTMAKIFEGINNNTTQFELSNNPSCIICDEFKNLTYEHVAIRILSAYKSSCHYQYCNTIAILTLWDIEATGTLHSFLENTFFTTKSNPILYVRETSSTVFPSSLEETIEFQKRIRGLSWRAELNVIPLLPSIQLYSTCCFNSYIYNSHDVPYSSMTREFFLNNYKSHNFGIIVDIYGFGHLITFYGFFSVLINGVTYPLCYCSEIPIKYLFDEPSQFIFEVIKPCSQKLVKTVISMDRIRPAIIIEKIVSDNLLVLNDKTFSAQYV